MSASLTSANSPAKPPRHRMVLVVVIVSSLISTGGLIASTFVKSPEQARADARPPAASILTATVEKRILASSIVTRGTVVAATKLEITPVVNGVGAQVVTALNVKVGSEVHAGEVLAAVSGRPMIVLSGKQPAFRDLKPGDSGADIQQLQNALKSLGTYQTGDRDGYFGSATKNAVRKLYAKLGYDVPDTGGPGGLSDKSVLQAADAAVDAAHLAVENMQRRISSGETVGPSEEPLDSQLRRLQGQVQQAQQARTDLISRTGPMLPLAEFVFVPQFPARVTALSARAGDPVKAPLITLGGGELAVALKLQPDQASIVRPGMSVELVSELLGGKAATGVVGSVGELSTEQVATGTPPYYPATVTPGQPLAANWAGSDVRVTITSAETDAPVLVVPLSAISASADGRTTVSVLSDNQAVVRVEVRAGVSGDGFVEVTPAVNGTLSEGHRVIVGATS